MNQIEERKKKKKTKKAQIKIIMNYEYWHSPIADKLKTTMKYHQILCYVP